jgi:hypothetical protein
MMIVSAKPTLTACVMLMALLGARTAYATHPDYEGERGLELEIMSGLGGAFTGDESVFLRPEDLPRPDVRPPSESFSSSVGATLAVGWRFAPFVSAGLTGSYQSLAPAHVYPGSEMSFEPEDAIRSWRVGVYGRVYPMAFFNGSRHNPRVFFDSWGDRRRLEPWVSLGVEFAQFTRHRSYDGVGFMDSYATWTTSYVGVPVGVGVEYRLLPRLAVGVNFAITPTFAGNTNLERFIHEVRPGVDQTFTEERSYTPAADSNTLYFVGLGVRYTFLN